jgi:hypothetical protein
MRDKLLLHLDVGPSGAFWRAALGLLFTLGLRSMLPAASLPAAAAALLALLFCVKAGAVVLRRVAGGSPEVAAAWTWRRSLARDHDSYQWRKLTWFGLGILGAGLLGSVAPWEHALGGACLLAGLVAEPFWRVKRLPLAPPVRA